MSTDAKKGKTARSINVPIERVYDIMMSVASSWVTTHGVA